MTRRELIRNAMFASVSCVLPLVVHEAQAIPIAPIERLPKDPIPDGPYWPKLVHEINTKEAYEQFLPDGLSGAPFMMKVSPVKVGIGFREPHDEESTKDQEAIIAAVNSRQPKATPAFDARKECAAANLFDNCRSTASLYLTPDGEPVASERHPWGEGGFCSNIIHGPADALAIEDAVTMLMLRKSWRGDPDPHFGPYEIVCHWNRVEEMEALCERDEDPNMVGRRARVVSSPFIQNEKQVFVRDAKRHPFAVLKRRDVRGAMDTQINQETGKKEDRYFFTEMYSFFASGWRGVVLITGEPRA